MTVANDLLDPYGSRYAVVRSAATIVGTQGQLLAVDTTGGVVTAKLPVAGVAGRVLAVADDGGQAAVNNITVSGQGSNIDGAPTFVMNRANQVEQFIDDGTQWRRIVATHAIFDAVGRRVAPVLQLADLGSGVAQPAPTGTGFPHITGGVQDAAAKLVANADVDAAAAIAVTKLATGGADGQVLQRAAGANAFALVANANVDPAAAIAGSKISPDFGAQTVQTTGDVVGGTSGKFGGGTLATAGAIRLANNVSINARNAGNSADVNLAKLDASNYATYGDPGGSYIQLLAAGTDIILGSAVRITGGVMTNAQPITGDGSSSPWGTHGKVDVAIAGNTTLTAAQYKYSAIKFTGAPGAGFTVTLPTPASDAAGYWKWLWNATGQIATIQLSAGTTKTLGIGNGAWFWVDTGGVRQAGAAIAP